MSNSIMRQAQRNKKDDFFTQREDIEKELLLYKNQFRNKKIFLPCDSSHSEFLKFFIEQQFYLEYKEVRSSCPIFSSGISEQHRVSSIGVSSWTLSDADADICKSKYIRDTIEWADIIITNPPFSLFREFMKIVLESGKQFCVLGNMNQILTKDLLPYIVSDKMWFGPSIYSGDRLFEVPDDYPLNAAGCFIDSNGKRYIRVKGVRWFTNMRPDSPGESRALQPTVSYKDMSYERFDYIPDVICINKTSEIPYDYDGLMGVPLTYFDKHNPEIFEIIDGVNRYLVLDKLSLNDEAVKNHRHLLTVNGKIKYFRFLIRKRKHSSNIAIYNWKRTI